MNNAFQRSGIVQFEALRVEGSAEKLEVMARRIREGLPLWHPDDRGTRRSRQDNDN